nr:glycosyltransferase [uncultured Rhodoferax sp.]
MNRLAVLLTAFNRKNTTLRCLHKVYDLMPGADVFLVDDGSSDQTSDSIKMQFPQVNLIQGDGNLFWNRGMYLAWSYAKKNNYHYYLWLNDDVILYDNCFDELFSCSHLCNDTAIISGIIQSHDKQEILYGGTSSKKALHQVSGSMQAITNLNGNVVLIPKSVFNVLGNLDPTYHHDLGDVDYGLRACRNNIKVLTTKVAVGSCDTNKICRVRLSGTSLKKRLHKLYSPLGNNPRLNFYFRKQHYGRLNACTYYLYIHLINVLPDNVVRFFFKDRYF